ncbi:hypothetical protein [Streptomyces sp. ST2-7A]|uniref:hypothetical protein n=1 Tax=Streptomyces sp. ST2-7A TaxID=2907214 RepID=UPI001F1B3805|nr:hypothetical protein [Streptomyces sp. ST2-7A]MCE7080460.1 hypothetical protein [Streptomyces sp. ST2-7A]
MPESSELRDQARHYVRGLIAAIGKNPEVQALYVLSSSANTSENVTVFGKDSDFDLAVIVDVPLRSDEWRPDPEDTYTLVADRIPDWVPEFSFYLPVAWGSMEVNVHQLIYQYEADVRTVWNSDKCDAYANKGEPLLDRAGRFGELIALKTREQQHRLGLEEPRLLNRITWDAREIAVKQAHRVGPPSGHVVLSMALEEVIDWVYITNGRLIPNRKWKLFQLRALGMVTEEQEQLLLQVMACAPHSMSDLERRIDVLARLCGSLGIPLDSHSIRRTRKSYQRHKQLLGARAAVYTSRPTPRLIPYVGRVRA